MLGKANFLLKVDESNYNNRDNTN